MLLLILSTLESIVIFILGAIAFFFLGRYFGGRLLSSIQPKYDALVSEHSNLQKQFKSRQKGISQIESERDKSKADFTELQSEFDRYKANDGATKARFTELQNEVVKLRSANESSKQTILEIQERLNAANDKFRANQKDTKTWREEIDALKRSENDLRTKLNASHSTNKQLRAKLEAIGNAKEEIERLKEQLKAAEKESKRFAKDCAYWEKQHYDAHHKLATSIEDIEALQAKVDNEILEKKGLEIQGENMMATLADFKKKLIYANERYHNLTGGQTQN